MTGLTFQTPDMTRSPVLRATYLVDSLLKKILTVWLTNHTEVSLKMTSPSLWWHPIYRPLGRFAYSPLIGFVLSDVGE